MNISNKKFVQTNCAFSVNISAIERYSANEHFQQKICVNRIMFFFVNISANEHFQQKICNAFSVNIPNKHKSDLKRLNLVFISLKINVYFSMVGEDF